MTQMYFTADGTYGSASEDEFVVIDINGWSDEMIDEIDGASDSDRMWLAKHFAKGDHPLEVDENGTPKCKMCFFEPKHLNGGGK